MFRLFLACAVLLTACSDSPTGPNEGGGGAGGAPPLEVGETCIAFCANTVGECDAFPLDEPDCQQFCQQDLNAEFQWAAACGMAAQAVFECATELDCEQVDAWIDRSPADGFPCQSEVDAYGDLIAAGACLP